MRKVCPECNGNLFEHDGSHDEIICRQCGLVLVAPATTGIIYPYFKLVPSQKKINIKIMINSHEIIKHAMLKYDLIV